MPGIFKVWIIETRTRGCTRQEWCPTGLQWFLAAAEAKIHARAFQARHKTHVYRVKRYVLQPTAEVVRG
jgi:hypothetical protein